MIRRFLLLACLWLAPCQAQQSEPPVLLRLVQEQGDTLRADYRLDRPARALHFPQYLGEWRSADWRPIEAGYRWVKEGDGERLERADGRAFRFVSIRIPSRYRALPKSYAPFSPFSDGGLLIYSGHYRACPRTPCDPEGAQPIEIDALAGRIVGVNGHRSAGHAAFVSDGEGTSIYIGSAEPIAADGFVAIVDPALEPGLRDALDSKLPAYMAYFADIYGPLSFTPELYVSLDPDPPEGAGSSSQGGTLPGQIFMHLYGPDWHRALAAKDAQWLYWFFAHEAAHLFQRDKSDNNGGSEQDAWIHEGGADALAALALSASGDGDGDYVARRTKEAAVLCDADLTQRPLLRATAEGAFDMHYRCGMIAALALDADLRRNGASDLEGFNKRFFKAIRDGATWNRATWLNSAAKTGASGPVLKQLAALTGAGSEAQRRGALEALEVVRTGRQ